MTDEIITAIRYRAADPSHAEIHLDGAFAFKADLLAAAALQTGQRLPGDERERLQRLDDKRRTHAWALSYLALRPRSRREMRRHLTRKGAPPWAVAEEMTRLETEGLLDDGAFARAWVRERQRLRPRSRMALGYELRQHGIADDHIAPALETVDESAAALALAAAHWRRWRRLAPDRQRHKLLGLLQRRGFDYEVSRQVWQRWSAALSAGAWEDADE